MMKNTIIAAIASLVIGISVFLVACDDNNHSAVDSQISNTSNLTVLTKKLSTVYRFDDNDYGITVYMVDTYRLATAPSVSAIRAGKMKVEPTGGLTLLVNKPKLYRLVDLDRQVVLYIVDTYHLATSPMVAAIPLQPFFP